MSNPETRIGLMLATDLGFRCDRATDRAIALARTFDGPAIAVTVIEPSNREPEKVMRLEIPSWHREASPLLQATATLRREFAGESRSWRVQVGEDDAGDHLAGVLAGIDGDTLVVTGPVREGVIGPTMLGSTVDRVLSRPGTSLLMVRDRLLGRAGYAHLLVASDFSEPSRRALLRARKLFPDARVSLLHGFSVPMLGFMDTSQPQAIAEAAQRLRDEGRAFLRESGLEGEVELLVEHGDPSRLVRQYVESFSADLVVVGTHGHGAVYQLVVGSVARRILATVNADALIVRD